MQKEMEMSIPHFVDLCSDDNETYRKVAGEFNPYLTTNLIRGETVFINPISQPELLDANVIGQEFMQYMSQYSVPIINSTFFTDTNSLNGFVDPSALPSFSSTPISRQFWKAGDYDGSLPRQSFSRNSRNRLRVHPKFLHSNATSHKWAFGAVAELLDNAVDEVQHGASFVVVNTITNFRDGNPALLIQDDGSGMDPESLRHCMSFGFSNKQSDTSIGHYGNGFKTSTMRLGADVIVFSRRCSDKRNITQSVGLLSFTFLKKINCDDVIVPMVDYEIDPLTVTWKPLVRHGQLQFQSNLSTLLRWSPFSTEAKLLEQFNDIGDHGTKIVVFNLWFNDDGDMELDFGTDPMDIMISGAPKIKETNNSGKLLDQHHIGTRYRYSLRVYLSILYLHLPTNFRIILRGQVVERHQLVKDLIFCECIKYKPQSGNVEHTVITTIGFLEGSPDVSIHGFNVYHKNRLILPFWSVLNRSNGKCKGVAGVLEVNFIKPTHNKQDFERSNLYEKLEARLREMVVEYWNYHCHLVGYRPARKAIVSDIGTHRQIRRDTENHNEATRKRRHVDNVDAMDCLKKSALPSEIANDLGSSRKNKLEHNGKGKGSKLQKLKMVVRENNKLQSQCVELEKVERQLLLKVQKLIEELQVVQKCHDNLVAELKAIDEVKVEN